MKNIITACVKRPVTMIMGMAALVLGAVFSLTFLPLDRLPPVSLPGVMVETSYPGMGAAEVRSLVTVPLEDALSSVKGLERIRSVSRDGASLVSLDFRWGTGSAASSALVREAVDAAYPALPEGIYKPSVVPVPEGSPHAIVAVFSKNGDGRFARDLAEYEMRARLRRIHGAGQVILSGGAKNEERVRLDIPAALARGFGPDDFADLLSRETAEVPAGSAREGDRELVVVSSARPASVTELASLILPAGSGPLRISDAAELSLEKSPPRSVFVEGGRTGTALEIFRRPGANPVQLSRDIEKAVFQASALFSKDAEIRIVYDASGGILEGVRGLTISFCLGAAAVAAALVFFTGRIRYGLLAALSIPVSAAAGICATAVAGRSLNSMSLGGLALGVGLVSDTSVIVLDMLVRRFTGDCRRPSFEAAGAAAASVAGSSFASTITTAVVFIPVVFLPGPLGALYGDLSVSLVSSITMGWLYAQFCLPSLYRLSFGGEKAPSSGAYLRPYRRLLLSSIRHPFKMMTAVLAAVIAGGLLFLVRPAVFVNPDEASEIVVSLVFPPGTDMDVIAEEGAAVSRILLDIEGIHGAFGRAGAEEEDQGRRADTNYRKEELTFRCLLSGGTKPAAALERVKKAVEERSLSSRFEGAETAVSFPPDATEQILGLSSVYTLVVRGRDGQEAGERAKRAAEELRKTGAAITLRPSGTRPELRIFPDREAAAWLHMPSARIAEVLRTATDGVIAARLEIEGRSLDVRVSGKEGRNMSPNALMNMPVITPSGVKTVMAVLGRMERREADAALARLDRSDAVYLYAVPAPGREGEFASASERLFTLFQPGISRADESVFSRYRTSLFVTLALVLLLLYLAMGAQFESFLLPLILMLAIPFSLAGTGPAVFISGMNPDSGTVLGLVVLFGLAVNNGIVLYEIGAAKRDAGLAPAAAVYRGAVERLRPVLITSVTTILALLPLVVTPLGNSQRSMALAMMSGMMVSTFLTILALPPVFIPFLKKTRGESG
ncbi:MAG: efflux RND transporter permease subunit [Treponema sp.]|jgi:multidrug efflux pump subunit AcrB|nr:efflux RND transporter permease subunit [Treponema sp.]